MVLKLKKQLQDKANLKVTMDKMVGDLMKKDIRFDQCLFIGILKNGVPLAKYIAGRLSEITGKEIPVALVDITLYRDDLIDSQYDPYRRKAEIPFPVSGKDVILVDDVLFTGRTVRAALTSILEFGRPRIIRLAVLVDRGHRELPIRADITGLECPTNRSEGIRVRIDNPTQKDGIYLYEEVQD
ncbi:MAG: bifunctional pyr operon transcriptional regulator/uracil phosphoribosyltransferase [Acidobacteria bacterium]|nr:MAG: bifunctional pyr operon transcriptional regulator/uracil phosphoribosyltransferase [Acidobacteriota bacterium]